MTPVHVEIGNVLTRAMRVDAIDGDDTCSQATVEEESTPTTVYTQDGSAVAGCDAVMAAYRDARPGVALIHLNGAPRTAVMGLAGLPTTELTIQGALRQAGSSVVQVRSADAASLEAQLVGIRALPLDVLAFAAPAPLTAERLLASGGVRPRVLARLLAMYNGPAGEHGPIEAVLGDAVEFTVLPPLRKEATVVDQGPTEQWLASAADRAVAADPELVRLRHAGFQVTPFARAFTIAAESMVQQLGEMADHQPSGAGTDAGKNRAAATLNAGAALIDLGGRYTEVAATLGPGRTASRWVEDLNELGLALPGVGSAKRGADAFVRELDVDAIGRWLPFEWATTGLADALANYLRRPFALPTNWRQVLTLLALGRVRLQRARSGFRMIQSGSGHVPGDWRNATGTYIVSGGYTRNLPGPGLALALALDGLEPLGVAEVWCDRFGLVPFMALDGGALPLSGTDPLLPRLATVVAPNLLQIDWRRPHEDDLLALVTVEREGGTSTTFRIVPGGLMRFPLRPGERAILTVHPMRDNDFGAGPGKVWRGRVVGGLAGLVFDARGRPVALPADPKVRQAKLLEWLDTLEAGRSRWDGERR